MIRKIEKKIMKAMGVERIPCPYGRKQESGLYNEDTTPKMMPVFVYPSLIPASFRDSFRKGYK